MYTIELDKKLVMHQFINKRYSKKIMFKNNQKLNNTF